MIEPPPGILRMTTFGVPGKCLRRYGTNRRAYKSVPPPSVYGTMTFTVLPAKLTSASALPVNTPITAAAAATNLVHLICCLLLMQLLPCGLRRAVVQFSVSFPDIWLRLLPRLRPCCNPDPSRRCPPGSSP